MFTVLIVDDRDNVLLSLRRSKKFCENGFTIVKECRNGREALSYLLENTVDLLITDIKMPVINGIELLSELHGRSLYTCAVVLSNYEDFSFAKQSFKLGAMDYILKPIEENNLDDVLKKVRKVIEEAIIRKEHIEMLEMIADDNLEFHQYKHWENSLVKCIESDFGKASEVVSSLLIQVEQATTGSITKSQIILFGILKNIANHLLASHPWISAFLPIDEIKTVSPPTFQNMDSLSKFFIDRIELFVQQFENHLSSGSDNLIQKIQLEILQGKDTVPSLKELADRYFVNPDYLSKLFKQKTGENFMSYVTRIKMERAKKLLDDGIYKAYEISQVLGYDDAKYFTRLFKRYTGLTPSEYKKG